MKKGADGRYQFDVGPEHVGARLLDIVSGALYGNVLDILREYIQNAVDAGAGQVAGATQSHFSPVDTD